MKEKRKKEMDKEAKQFRVSDLDTPGSSVTF